jgi:hypothetical protein
LIVAEAIMKKILMVVGLFLILAVGTAGARNLNGIGLYGNLVGNSTGSGGGLGLSLKYGSFPVIGLEWNLVEKSSSFGGSVDYWIVNRPLTGIMYYYLGIGAFVGITSGNPSGKVNFGGRVPLGLQIFPLDPLELFLEISPMITIIPTINWTAAVRFGFRVRF